MKAKALTLTILAGAAAVWATNARVESMGKSATFFMDDVSMFDNPANVNIYPNFLIGELGKIIEFSDTNTRTENQDPAEPFGGGILSFSLNRDKNAETRYPMVSVGAIMNHENVLVNTLNDAAMANHHFIPRPVVPNSDFFLGYTLANGTMIGAHVYSAMQSIEVPYSDLKNVVGDLDETGLFRGDTTLRDSAQSIFSGSGFPSTSEKALWTSSVFRGDLGVNMPVSQNMDLEVSGGLALLKYEGPTSSSLGLFKIPSNSENDLSFFVNARLFSTLVSLNGELVPVFKFKRIVVRDYEVQELEGGLGANVTLDRGFFWAGLEFVRNNTTIPETDSTTDNQITVQLPLSFGIERNIVWDWFVMRVGFRKVLWGSSSNQNDLMMLKTNPEANMTVDDHVGFGVGLNIEEKLKIDGVVAEDIPYKWGNLVSGNSHHVLSRITATYSF